MKEILKFSKKVIKVLVEKWWDFRFSSDHVSYARKLGVKVGEDCKLLCNVRKCFGNEPYLISIGNHVEVCDSVRFMPHDGGAWVYRNTNPNCAIYSPINVGNNVFIGIHSIILPGVTIGDNVVIGAGAIVTRDLPGGGVYAGVPARRVNDFDTYIRKVNLKSHDILNYSLRDKQEYLLNIIYEKGNEI